MNANGAEDHEEAFAKFRSNTLQSYVNWYWQDSASLEKKYIRCFWAGLFLSLLTTILAAFPRSYLSELVPNGSDLINWFVVATSTLAAFFNVTLAPRYKKMTDDREKGRIKLDALSQRLTLKEYPEKIRPDLEEVIAAIAAVESDFGALDRDAGKGPAEQRI